MVDFESDGMILLEVISFTLICWNAFQYSVLGEWLTPLVFLMAIELQIISYLFAIIIIIGLS